MNTTLLDTAKVGEILEVTTEGDGETHSVTATVTSTSKINGQPHVVKFDSDDIYEKKRGIWSNLSVDVLDVKRQ
jgi:hypothetical protein